jgi:hypothetical protein
LLPALGVGLCLGLCLLAPAAWAGELYGSAGLPGAFVGYAQPLGPHLGLRADFATLGSRSRGYTESGIAYSGELQASRSALLADWFPLAGSFRLSGGIAFNRYKLALDASGAGGTLQVGSTTYTTTAADGLNVQVEFPRTTPYVGLGWGHQAGSGWRTAFDLGALVGRATVRVTPRGQLANPAAQADVAQETAQLRDGVGKVQAIPQLTFSVGYSF